jgi:hypothetical protein
MGTPCHWYPLYNDRSVVCWIEPVLDCVTLISIGTKKTSCKLDIITSHLKHLHWKPKPEELLTLHLAATSPLKLHNYTQLTSLSSPAEPTRPTVVETVEVLTVVDYGDGNRALCISWATSSSDEPEHLGVSTSLPTIQTWPTWRHTAHRTAHCQNRTFSSLSIPVSIQARQAYLQVPPNKQRSRHSFIYTPYRILLSCGYQPRNLEVPGLYLGREAGYVHWVLSSFAPSMTILE